MPQFSNKEKIPLLSFRLDFQFSKPLDITFEKMAKIEAFLKTQYRNTTQLNLINLNMPTNIQIPLEFGPIRFASEQKDNEIDFFSNGIVFIFSKYTKWEEVSAKILNTFSELCKIFNIDTINQLRMEYIDEFRFLVNNFSLNDYFTLNCNKSNSWELDYSDFHIGIRFKTDSTDKSILRLRGIDVVENNYKIRVESIYLTNKEISITPNFSELKDVLNSLHQKIEDHFWGLLSDKTKQIYGVQES